MIETFTDYYFGTFFFQRGQDWTTRLKMFIQNSGSGGGHKFWSNGGPGWDLSMSEMKLKLTNEGSLTVDVLGRRMAPGTSATFFAGEISDASSTFEGAIMRLPGNYNFDYDTFRYTESRYGFEFQNIKLYNGEGGFLGGQATQEGPSHSRTLFTYTRSAGTSSNPGKAYLRSYLTNVNTYCDDKSTVIVGGMAFPNPQQGGGRSDPFWGARFWESPVGISCGVGVAYRDASNGE